MKVGIPSYVRRRKPSFHPRIPARKILAMSCRADLNEEQPVALFAVDCFSLSTCL
jgi:hypothetical protein